MIEELEIHRAWDLVVVSNWATVGVSDVYGEQSDQILQNIFEYIKFHMVGD